MRILYSAITVVGLTIASAVPVQAQAVSNAAVLAACSGTSATQVACTAAMNTYIANLRAAGVTPAQYSQAMADLVVSLAETTAGTPNPIVASAIRQAGASLPADDPQVALINSIAVSVENGDDDFQTAAIQEPSPN